MVKNTGEFCNAKQYPRVEAALILYCIIKLKWVFCSDQILSIWRKKKCTVTHYCIIVYRSPAYGYYKTHLLITLTEDLLFLDGMLRLFVLLTPFILLTCDNNCLSNIGWWGTSVCVCKQTHFKRYLNYIYSSIGTQTSNVASSKLRSLPFYSYMYSSRTTVLSNVHVPVAYR